MDDLDRWTAERALSDPEFTEGFERGYQAFKLGAVLRQARRDAGLTQVQLAERLGTHKSAISRMENQAEDIRLSTLQRYAEAVGRILTLELVPDSQGILARAVSAYQDDHAAAPATSVRARRTKPAARYAEHGD